MSVLCPNCDAALPAWLIKTGVREKVCPACFKGITVEFFPAMFRRNAVAAPEPLPLAEGQACCYEHSTKPAVQACGKCGRFVCALCEVDIGGQIWCPSCAMNRSADQAEPAGQTSRVLYDSIALSVATWPLLFFYFAVISAPIAIFVSLRYWKKPSSIVPRTKWRFVAALLLGVVELGLMGSLIFALFWQAMQRRGL